MDVIKISQESLDAFNREKELNPAPIDGKNILKDWIEDVFDYQTCLWGEKNQAMGFIHGRPVLAEWNNNNLLWKFFDLYYIEDTDHLAVLRDRLASKHDPEGDLVEDFHVVGNILLQKFYWKND